MQTNERSLHMMFSAAIAAMISYLGVVAIPAAVLVLAMMTDYITGMLSAWHDSAL